jgi:hypothetical protein
MSALKACASHSAQSPRPICGTCCRGSQCRPSSSGANSTRAPPQCGARVCARRSACRTCGHPRRRSHEQLGATGRVQRGSSHLLPPRSVPSQDCCSRQVNSQRICPVPSRKPNLSRDSSCVAGQPVVGRPRMTGSMNSPGDGRTTRTAERLSAAATGPTSCSASSTPESPRSASTCGPAVTDGGRQPSLRAVGRARCCVGSASRPQLAAGTAPVSHVPSSP